MKQVREQSDSSAFIVLNKKGEDVAHVQFRYGSGGSVQCDVWSRNPGEKWVSLTHQKKAGGYGYDKACAALAGAVIEGFQMANHCGHGEPAHEKAKVRLMAAYKKRANSGVPISPEESRVWEAKAKKIGARFANYSPRKAADGSEFYAYISLHTQSGLDRLRDIGFRVIQVL